MAVTGRHPLARAGRRTIARVDCAVFISYRGEQSGSYAVLLHRELSRHFGQGTVFLDTESLPAGSDYVRELLSRVRQAQVLIALVGPGWLSAVDPVGRRRIDDSRDWMRRELAEAFDAGVSVIPVLTDGADMPLGSDLPTDIALLGRCQYRRLRYRDASADLVRLVADLETRGIPTRPPFGLASGVPWLRKLLCGCRRHAAD